MFDSSQLNQLNQCDQQPDFKPGILKFARFIEKIRLPIAILLVAFIFSGVSIHAVSPSINGQAYASPSRIANPADIYYIDQINQLRASLSEKPLYYKAELETSASFKARDMLQDKYWGHYSPSGDSFADFIWQQTPTSQRVGENLARCFATRDSAYEALVKSPTHYQIMIGDFTSMGVSELVNSNDGCTYTVLHFAKN
ncbi:CAP domain-containing protein [Candidatus Saccharibacteria bacterium]|jgi:uncharacterized protein YkwD|nr:CAP domain-containing protein [Candidatus Saccharibacteria bacterium]